MSQIANNICKNILVMLDYINSLVGGFVSNTDKEILDGVEKYLHHVIRNIDADVQRLPAVYDKPDYIARKEACEDVLRYIKTCKAIWNAEKDGQNE